MDLHLNLTPWRARRRQRRWRHSLLALALSMLAGAGGWWWRHHSVEQALAAHRQHHHTLSGELADLEARMAAVAQNARQQRAQALTHAHQERERLALVRLLDTLARHTPDGVVLTQAHWQDGTLTLTARTISNAQMAHTVQQWAALGAGDLNVSAITRAHEGGDRITLSVPWSVADAVPALQLAQSGAGR